MKTGGKIRFSSDSRGGAPGRLLELSSASAHFFADRGFFRAPRIAGVAQRFPLHPAVLAMAVIALERLGLGHDHVVHFPVHVGQRARENRNIAALAGNFLEVIVQPRIFLVRCAGVAAGTARVVTSLRDAIVVEFVRLLDISQRDFKSRD
jgi:hypothetical protein